MQYVNLLGMHPSCEGLRPFAKSFFDALGVTDREERGSGSYVDGYYLKGSLDGMTFVVAISDEGAHEDVPYWIHISADLADPGALEGAVSQLVRDKALPMGFQLAHIVNFGKRGEQRIDY
ncbi:MULTISPECIES: hypothetical protein [Burkholderia]|uniref:Uncharacterized protein n=1 Tax=Burkholderia paludis TaxID=1506587 RepID=A0A6J5E0R0_9BURK|nr:MULTISPECIES: hypothetical protein [Burkholderia]CAB3759989.1 hypothetical protein LMG30113_03577 [Burkholderia paludis]VWC06471.1 hypothetical protein BPA30113_05008 [Burkholderia paludis]